MHGSNPVALELPGIQGVLEIQSPLDLDPVLSVVWPGGQSKQRSAPDSAYNIELCFMKEYKSSPVYRF